MILFGCLACTSAFLNQHRTRFINTACTTRLYQESGSEVTNEVTPDEPNTADKANWKEWLVDELTKDRTDAGSEAKPEDEEPEEVLMLTPDTKYRRAKNAQLEDTVKKSAFAVGAFLSIGTLVGLYTISQLSDGNGGFTILQ